MSTPSLEKVRHVRIRANGIEFHVALAGRDDAPLLLCLHGFPECWYSWRHQLAGLADRFLVAAPDLRGYGESEKPAGGYEIGTLAADVAALIAALGRESADLVGHDWGALIAYAAAAAFPGAIDHLVCLNAPHPAATSAAFRSLDQLKRSWYVFAIQIPGIFDWRLARDDAAIVPRIFLSGARRRDAFARADLETLRAAMARPGAIPAALAYYRANLSPLALLRGAMRRVRAVARPTLVLYGRDDPFVGPDLFLGHEKHFTGPYQIRYIPDCGHWTQQEVPELVNEAILQFTGATSREA